MNKFYLIATPIGNLEDITLRALRILKEVDVIFCENTLHSKKLLAFYKIDKKLISLHKFNESMREDLILNYLKDGDVALISDAGTPGISDPGQFIVKRLREKNIKITSLPGANSIICALSLTGVPFNSFVFLGFVDKNRKQMINSIQQNLNNDLLIFFETAKRLTITLKALFKQFGDIEIMIAKELTKQYEKFVKVTISDLLSKDYLNLKKGEFVLIIESKQISLKHLVLALIKDWEIENLDFKQQVLIISKHLSVSKNYLYQLLKK